MAMKISSSFFLLILSLLAVSTSARPCKTLFYFSTTTTTYYPLNPSNPNSLNSINYPQIPHHNPRYFTLIFTGTSHFNDIRQTADEEDSRSSSSSSGFPHNWFSSAITKDIMSVVGALLFGVGCGAMAAGIMYFIWALFSPRSLDFDDVDSSSDDDDDEDDDIAAIKRKLGYVAVPVNPEVADDINKTAPPAKDMV